MNNKQLVVNQDPPQNFILNVHEEDEDNIINFYELDDVKRFQPKYVNPTYNHKNQPLAHPLRLVICGASGGGKSNLVTNIIRNMDSTFQKILIFTQNKEEPLYDFLESKIDYPELEILEGIESVEKFDFDKLEEVQTLCIFDDMCIEKETKQSKIKELFIRGRKMCGNKGISCMYLTQSYFQCPPLIRKQMTGLVIRKINGKRDLTSILRECSIDATTQQLLNIYEYTCPEKIITKFLFIDLSAPKTQRFRQNFSTILDINDFK